MALRQLLVFLFCLFWSASVAQARNLIGSYTAFIGPADRIDSHGVALTSFGAILQQDRANYHRFGRRDALDMTDPIFANPEYRARIPDIWLVMRGSEYVVDRVLTGQHQILSILIYGLDGEPAFVIVLEGAG